MKQMPCITVWYAKSYMFLLLYPIVAVFVNCKLLNGYILPIYQRQKQPIATSHLIIKVLTDQKQPEVSFLSKQLVETCCLFISALTGRQQLVACLSEATAGRTGNWPPLASCL